MANRTRNIVLRVPVTQEERALIQQKMAQLHTKNFSAYARKMLIDGYIVHMDTSDIRAQTAELQKIGVNVNQIARRINSTGTVYAHVPVSPLPEHFSRGYIGFHMLTARIYTRPAMITPFAQNLQMSKALFWLGSGIPSPIFFPFYRGVLVASDSG